VVNLKKNRLDDDMSKSRQIREQPYKKQLEHLQKHFRTDVTIHTNFKGAGHITIKFKNDEEFDRLQKLIG
jgi:hypothetical protein